MARFFRCSPLKAARLPPALLFLRGHTTIAKKVRIYLRKIPAIFICNSLMYNDKVPCFLVVDYGIIQWISLRNKTQIRVCFCKVLFSKRLCFVIILVSTTQGKRRILAALWRSPVLQILQTENLKRKYTRVFWV